MGLPLRYRHRRSGNSLNKSSTSGSSSSLCCKSRVCRLLQCLKSATECPVFSLLYVQTRVCKLVKEDMFSRLCSLLLLMLRVSRSGKTSTPVRLSKMFCCRYLHSTLSCSDDEADTKSGGDGERAYKHFSSARGGSPSRDSMAFHSKKRAFRPVYGSK